MDLLLTVLCCKAWLRYSAPSVPILLLRRSSLVSVYVKKHNDDEYVMVTFLTVFFRNA